jgi:hypothetical protein
MSHEIADERHHRHDGTAHGHRIVTHSAGIPADGECVVGCAAWR